MKIGVIIQARFGSKRLPGKVLLTLRNQSILHHSVERIKQAKHIDEVIIATSSLKKDDKIVDETKKIGIPFFRGSEHDVLSRYYYTAKKHALDNVVRVTSDCPLIDPYVIDKAIQEYLEFQPTISTNATSDVNNRTYPRGLDVEVFSFSVLEEAFSNAIEPYQREHVTPYIYENAKKIHLVKNEEDYSKYRWTLDTKEDFEAIQKIYDILYHGAHDFYLNDIVKLMKDHPEIVKINARIKQKKLSEVDES